MASVTVTVAVNPLNDETPDCTNTALTATEDEAQPLATAIALTPALSCTDVDADVNEQLSYSLTGAPRLKVFWSQR